MNVLFAAGGTAGHINPALAIADKLTQAFPETHVLFVGKPDGMEKKLVGKAGYDFVGVDMYGFERGFSPKSALRNVKAAYCFFLSAKRSVKRIIGEFKPDLAIGTGGYVTATVLSQTSAMKIPTITHESNSYPGMATKMLSTRADKVLLASEDAKKHLKDASRCIVTGNPLRTNIPIEERSAAKKRLGLSDDFTVLSFGGSLGANRITNAVAELIAWENKAGKINHIHSYGSKNKEIFENALSENGVSKDAKKHIFRDYIDNMYTCMSAADLIISRAGAMTITELTEIGRASILVPYPAAAENHQFYNAKTLADKNAALIIEDAALTGEALVSAVSDLYENRQKLLEMEQSAHRMKRSDAADKIVAEIIDLVGEEKLLK